MAGGQSGTQMSFKSILKGVHPKEKKETNLSEVPSTSVQVKELSLN
jgi:hypothetical protein